MSMSISMSMSCNSILNPCELSSANGLNLDEYVLNSSFRFVAYLPNIHSRIPNFIRKKYEK